MHFDFRMLLLACGRNMEQTRKLVGMCDKFPEAFIADYIILLDLSTIGMYSTKKHQRMLVGVIAQLPKELSISL